MRAPKLIHIWDSYIGTLCGYRLKMSDHRISANQREIEEFKPHMCPSCMAHPLATPTEAAPEETK